MTPNKYDNDEIWFIGLLSSFGVTAIILFLWGLKIAFEKNWRGEEAELILFIFAIIALLAVAYPMGIVCIRVWEFIGSLRSDSDEW